ncbi:hypothetical protein O0I10_001545 [Lichtheimia ornata]|uniref:Uncharacterized protein n=1 Tax=Lichtheimia ornata TaxID=688661 RepID=A0AAD7XZ42_9FUNG|nr:uncharacterized protein O0I10_001545 [Lichtheimia ornata]KAJ8662584.1 hypothetical protein O0I10_001545 [Lichtheimia ornata]
MSKRACKRVDDLIGERDLIWLHLKQELENYEYWKDTPYTNWDITHYDRSLSNKLLINKRDCHRHLKSDLDLLRSAFVHHGEITKMVDRLKKALAHIRKDELNEYFWEHTAKTLQKNHLQRQEREVVMDTAVLGIKSSLLEQHAQHLAAASSCKRPCDASPSSSAPPPKKTLCSSPTTLSSPGAPSSAAMLSSLGASSSTATSSSPTVSSSAATTPSSSSSITPLSSSSTAPSSSSSSTAPSSSSSSTAPSSSSSSTAPSSSSSSTATSNTQPAINLLESDSIICDSAMLSIATVIKRKALVIHDRYLGGTLLSSRQRKMMSNGLSSILDLVDQSLSSQRSLFTVAEWKNINTLYQNKYSIPPASPLHRSLQETWMIIDSSVNNSGNIKLGLLYLYKIFPKYHSSKLMPSLRVFEHILNLLDQEPHLLQEQPSVSVSEADYISFVWLPLFRHLFHSGCNIRIKTGETAFPFSTHCKQELYPGATNMVGFKVDVRFVVDLEKNEHDICSVEACCNGDKDSKVVSDEGKLNREMKDNLDNMIAMVETTSPKQECQYTTWGVQIIGPSCVISSIHLSDSGLYIVLPRFDITLPRSICDLKHFETTMIQLLTFQQQLQKSADSILSHHQASKHLRSLNHNTSNNERTHIHRQRDTWYTPPEKTSSRIPLNLTSLSRPRSLTEKLLTVACEESISALMQPAAAQSEDDLDADEFGWKYDGEMWHNRITGATRTSDPYHESE